MANRVRSKVEKEAVAAMRSVNYALIEVSKSIDRAIDSFSLTPNQELDLYTALMSVLETLAVGIIGDDEDVKIETIQ